jgi:hypothetical protein
MLLGYEPGTAAYHIFDPAKNHVLVSHDVIFDEDAAWPWSKDGHAQEDAQEYFIVEHFTCTAAGDGKTAASTHATSAPRAPDDADHVSPGLDGSMATPGTPVTPLIPLLPTVEFVSPPMNASVPPPGEEAPAGVKLIAPIVSLCVVNEQPVGNPKRKV